jgi:hypothetical protein
MITPGSITGITGLMRQTVFFLNLNNSPAPTLVVKGEPWFRHQGLEVSIKWSSKLMKSVNNQLVNTKIMTPAEISIFLHAAQAVYGPRTNQARAWAPGNRVVWVKMPYVPGLSSADVYTAAGPDQQRMIATIIKFSDPNAWTELGKIVAVDVFNGNNDRFVVTGQPQGRLANAGNVMFGNASSVFGLDTFDSGTFMGGPNAVSNLTTQQSFPELRILIDAQQRGQFAAACILGVAMELDDALSRPTVATPLLVPVQTPAGLNNLAVDRANIRNLFNAYIPDFDRGLDQGATALKNYLQSKRQQYFRAAPHGPWQPVQQPGGQQPAQLGAHRQPVQPRQPAQAGGHRQPVHRQPAQAGGHRQPAYPNVNPAPAIPAPAIPAPAIPAPAKTLPPGVVARMRFLGW